MQGGDLSAVDQFLLNLIKTYLKYAQKKLTMNNLVPEQCVFEIFRKLILICNRCEVYWKIYLILLQ